MAKANKDQKMIKTIVHFLFYLFLSVGPYHPAFAQTASILPQPKTQYLDDNGNPLSSGKVYNYIVNTFTFKNTWQDSTESTLNTNPVTLDAGGRGLIYGQGAYRQIIKKANGDTVVDGVTSSTGSGGGSASTGDGDLVGTVKPWAGISAPNQYAFAYGQELSRSTYSSLYTAITLTTNVICTSANNTLSGISDTGSIKTGAPIEGTCIPASTTVVSKTSSTVLMSNPATITINTTATFFPFGNGNGTTTFNVPDLRGYTVVGRNNMGGTASAVMTQPFLGTSPNAQGAVGGAQSIVILQGFLPNVTLTTTIASGQGSHTHTGTTTAPNFASAGTAGGGNGLTSGTATVAIAAATLPAMAGTTPLGGAGSPMSLVQPSMMLNYIIKITPDTNSSVATGVTSLGGMTGDIACGANVLCTGNTISVPILTLPYQTFLANFTSSPTGSAVATTLVQIGATIPAPKFARYSAQTLTVFTPDADATLLEIVLIGGGGGGMGNAAGNPQVPTAYAQYGGAGSPSAFMTYDQNATITNASPGIVTTSATATWTCNQPVYFTAGSGTLPAEIVTSTVYYIQCNPPGPAPTGTTFAVSTTAQRYPTAAFAAQTPINTSGGSGTVQLHAFRYTALQGQGGGVIGDQALSGSYVGCDANGPAGYLQSAGLQGAVGNNIYGANIAPGAGGSSIYGGAGDGGEGGINGTGGGGSGANPTGTSSGGGGGGAGGSCRIKIRPVAATSYSMICGSGGIAGIAESRSVTVSSATPAVFTSVAHGYPPNAAITLTASVLPTGGTPAWALATTYYVDAATLTADTFQLANSAYGTPRASTSTGTAVVAHSGNAAGAGGNGVCEIWQYYGLN